MTVQTAYTLMLRTPEGRIVLADILARTYHNEVTNDDEQRVLQQFAIQTLQMAGLTKKGSFPIEYVLSLTGTKLHRPTLWERLGRLLGGKSNV